MGGRKFSIVCGASAVHSEMMQNGICGSAKFSRHEAIIFAKTW